MFLGVRARTGVVVAAVVTGFAFGIAPASAMKGDTLGIEERGGQAVFSVHELTDENQVTEPQEGFPATVVLFIDNATAQTVAISVAQSDAADSSDMHLKAGQALQFDAFVGETYTLELVNSAAKHGRRVFVLKPRSPKPR